MASPQQRIVKVGDDIIAFPGDLEDDHVKRLIKSFREKKNQPKITEESEHARQLKPAQPVSTAIPKVPDWVTTPLSTTVQSFEEKHPNLYGLDLKRQKQEEQVASQFRAAHPVAGGVVQGANQFAEGMTSPANMALMLGAPESKILSGIFATQAMRGSYSDAKAAQKAFEAGNNPEAIKYATQALLGLGVGALAGKHAYKGLPEGVRTQLASEEGSATLPTALKPTTAYQTVDQSKPFYLKSENLINEKMKGPMPAEDVHKMLLSNGVKPEEMQWTGLDDLLKSKGKGKVTPQEVQEHLAGNNLQIKEVMKGNLDHGAPLTPTQVEEAIKGNQRGAIYGVDRDSGLLATERSTGLTTKALAKYLQDNAHNFRVYKGPVAEVQPTKFGSYALPGGENYRELLITLPRKYDDAADVAKMDEISGKLDEIGEPSKNPELWQKLSDELNVIADKRDAEKQKVRGSQFHTNHWPEDSNVFGHIRFNDRTGPNGEKILHLEEIQSDAHQKGRTHRYVDPKKPFAVVGQAGNYATKAEAEAAADAGNTPRQFVRDERIDRPEGAVPDLPFKKTWPELMLKRMIKYAQDHGYDGVSWSPGDVQAERYDLSKQVSRISYAPADGTLRGYDLNNGQVITENANPEELENYIGKDAAKKLIEKSEEYKKAREDAYNGKPFEIEHGGKTHTVTIVPDRVMQHGSVLEAMMVTDGTNRWYEPVRNIPPLPELKGVDLKVGGQGMKGFYDKIIPDAANKLGKQWGAKVGETTIETGKYPLKEDWKAEDAFVMHRGDQYQVWTKGPDGTGRFREHFDSQEKAEQFIADHKEGYKKPVTVPYLPIKPQAKAVGKSVPYSLFGLAGAAVGLQAVKQKAQELQEKFREAGLSQ